MKKSIEGNSIEMTRVESNLFYYVGYNEEKSLLLIETCRGPALIYIEVPKSVFDGLMSATAIDDYFNENIRYTYKERRVN